MDATVPGRAGGLPPGLAAYATGVALNGFLPANIGTFVMLLMFVAIIPRPAARAAKRRSAA